MIYRVCLLILCCSVFLASCQSSGPKVSDDQLSKRAKFHYQIGLDAIQRGQLAKAFEKLMQSNSENPKQPQVLGALAYAWRLRGDFKESESFYKQAIRAGGGSSTKTNYGSLLIVLEKYKKAEKVLRQALKDPRYRKQFLAHILLGDALLGQGKLEDAIANYRKASMMNPRQSISQVKEAKAYVVFKRFNFAKALYETLLRKEPNNRPALEGLMKILTKRTDVPVARKYLAAYIEHSTQPLERAWAADELTRLARAQ